jgi:uncharacterized protein YeaO (DUF488 family)
MPIRIVRLGTPRAAGEGLRIGTVRRPPRGVPKSAWAAQDWYDVWYPNLAPSAEMAAPDASRSLDVLAALSHHASFALGCYCADESHCHRSVLRELLAERGAALVPAAAAAR